MQNNSLPTGGTSIDMFRIIDFYRDDRYCTLAPVWAPKDRHILRFDTRDQSDAFFNFFDPGDILTMSYKPDPQDPHILHAENWECAYNDSGHYRTPKKIDLQSLFFGARRPVAPEEITVGRFVLTGKYGRWNDYLFLEAAYLNPDGTQQECALALAQGQFHIAGTDSACIQKRLQFSGLRLTCCFSMTMHRIHEYGASGRHNALLCLKVHEMALDQSITPWIKHAPPSPYKY